MLQRTVSTFLKICLLLSLLVNALVAPILIQRITQRPANTALIAESEDEKLDRISADFTQQATPQDSRDRLSSTFDLDSWSELLAPGSSKRSFANRMAREGMPLHLIKGLVSAQLAFEYDQKRANARFPPDLPYWERFTAGQAADANAAKIERDFAAEMEHALADLPPSSSAINKRRTKLNYGDMSADTIERIRELTGEYLELRKELGAREMTRQEANLQSVVLRRAFEEDLATALTPEELRTYQLRSSETALEVMASLAGIDLTEAEYERVFDLTKDWEKAHVYGPVEELSTENPTTARFELYDTVVEALGNERGARYLSNTDSQFRELRSLLVGSNVATADNVALAAWKKFTDLHAIAKGDSSTASDEVLEPSTLMRELDSELAKHLNETALSRYNAVLRPRMMSRLVR